MPLPTMAAGVMLTRLFTMGMPNSRLMSSPVLTRFLALLIILSYTLRQRASTVVARAQSSRLIPIVIVRTSRFSWSIILFVSMTSDMFITCAS